MVRRGIVACLVLVSLLVISLGSVMRASGAADDLHLASVVPIQVVPNPPALIVNKSAALCVYIESTFSTRVYADIEVTYDFETKHYLERGPSGTGVPLDPGLNKVFIPGGNCTAHSPGWWTFPLTLIWDRPGADLNIKAEVDPDNKISESDETNNLETTSGGVNVSVALPLRVLIMPINVHVDDMLASKIEAAMIFMRDTYPVADNSLIYSISTTILNQYIAQGQAPERYAPGFAARARELGYDRAVILVDGMYGYGGVACGMLQNPEDRTPVIVVKSALWATSDLIAHEVGHTYYLWHPHDIGIPVNSCTRYWTYQRDQDSLASTFMSYRSKLPAGIPTLVRWVDEQRYCTYPKSWIDLSSDERLEVDGVWQWNLYQQLVLRLPDMGRVIHMGGTIFSNGTLTLTKNWRVIPEGLPDLVPTAGAPQPRDYRIVFRDLGGTMIATMGFNASFLRSAPLDETDDYYEDEWSEVPFSFYVPYYDGIHTIQVTNSSDTVLAERIVSLSAPIVQLLSPDGGEVQSIGSTLPISWDASDPEDDDLSYVVAYSSDSGKTWNPIASNLSTESVAWNTSGLLSGSEYMVKVIASDGFNSAEDSSGGFAFYDATQPTTAASLAGERHESGWFVSKVNVTLRAEDNSRVNRTEYSFNGVDWMNYSSPLSFGEEGSRRVFFRSVDHEGNTEDTRSCEFGIDLDAPSVRIISPTQDEKVRAREVNVSWESDDTGSGVSRYELRINNGSWIDVGNASSYLVSDLEKGAVFVELRAFDFAGHDNVTSVTFRYEPRALLGISTTGWVVIGAAVVLGSAVLAFAFARRKKPPRT